MTVWSTRAVVCRCPSLSGTDVRIDCDRLIGLGVGRLRLSVQVDLHSGSAARAVVGNEHVSPHAGLHLILGHDLECVRRPLVDEMARDAPVFDPEIPASIIVAIVHPSKNRPDQIRLVGSLTQAPNENA